MRTSAGRILIIGGGAMGLVALLQGHGYETVTEEEYRGSNNPHNVTREQVGLGCLGNIPHLVDYGVILPSLTAGMYLEFERWWHAYHRPELLRNSLEKFRLPHVRGTCLG